MGHAEPKQTGRLTPGQRKGIQRIGAGCWTWSFVNPQP